MSATQCSKSRLRLTMIDVGWGDSIFLESVDQSNDSLYALVDCNDTTYARSSYIFLKRFLEKKGMTFPLQSNLFDWVLLSHAHADHGNGLQRILKDFGTSRFWYPSSPGNPAMLAKLVKFASGSGSVSHHEFVDTSKQLPTFGDVRMDLLWPEPGHLSTTNENNNSVVLTLTLGQVSFVLTGDAEADAVWTQIASQIPATTKFFKVPHHGASNGTFTSSNTTPWLSHVSRASPDVKLGISSHVHPHPHPDSTVVTALSSLDVYRTDMHYHVLVETDGIDVTVSYSHV